MSADAPTIELADAVLLLPAGDMVHTFRSSSFGMLGADWERASLIAAMEKAPAVFLTGPSAQAMRHGVAIEDENGMLFIETRLLDGSGR